MSFARWLHAAALMGAVSVLGCSTPKPLTEILLFVNSNLTPGSEIVSVQVRVRREGSTTDFFDRVFFLSGDAGIGLPGVDSGVGLPGSIAVLPGSDDTRAVEFIVTANPGRPDAFSQRTITSFQPGRVLRLDMFLARECTAASVRATCESMGQTCGRNGLCEPVRRMPGDLDAGSDIGNDIPSIDAADALDVPVDTNDAMDVPMDSPNCGDGGPCVNGTTCTTGACVCAAPRMTCGTECADITTNVLHCGRCNSPCPTGTPCTAGVCVCPTGQQLCATPAPHCAVVATDPTSCGATCRVCPFAGLNGRATCTAGTCGAVCDPGYMLLGASQCTPLPGATCPGQNLPLSSPGNSTPFSGNTTMSANMRSATCGGLNSPEMYYSFQATEAGVQVNILPTGWDAVVYLLDGCAGTVVGCANANAVGGVEQLSAATTPGRSYIIVVDGNGTMDRGTFMGSVAPVRLCGNRTLDPSEDCDDGNTLNGDGCDVQCNIEFSLNSGGCSSVGIEYASGIQQYRLSFTSLFSNNFTPSCGTAGFGNMDWNVILRPDPTVSPLTSLNVMVESPDFLPTLMATSGTVCGPPFLTCSSTIVPPSPPNRVQVQFTSTGSNRLIIDGMPSTPVNAILRITTP